MTLSSELRFHWSSSIYYPAQRQTMRRRHGAHSGPRASRQHLGHGFRFHFSFPHGHQRSHKTAHHLMQKPTRPGSELHQGARSPDRESIEAADGRGRNLGSPTERGEIVLPLQNSSGSTHPSHPIRSRPVPHVPRRERVGT